MLGKTGLISRHIHLTTAKMAKRLRSCTIAVVQMTSTANKDDNWWQLESLVCEAVHRGSKMVFLPEGCDYIASSRAEALALAESDNGPYDTKLMELAKRKDVWLSVGGIHIKSPWASESRLSNTHLLISSDGTVLERYKKTHLFSNTIPGVAINEGDYVEPGKRLQPPVPSPAGNVGLAICYDLRFPSLSQALRRLGAHILTFPSAFTVATGTAHWELLLRARAVENQCYVVAAAQCGQHNDKRSSYGHAMIVDPWGTVLCKVPEGIGIATAEVDMSVVSRVRAQMPCMLHCREDLHSLTLVPHHWRPQLLHCERLPAPTTSLQFGADPILVPGEAVFLNSALVYACTNLYPRVPGHSLLMPRCVKKRFTDLTVGELSDLSQATVVTHRLLCQAYGAKACEVVIQDGHDSGQTVKHVHVHVLPQDGDSDLLPPDAPAAPREGYRLSPPEEMTAARGRRSNAHKGTSSSKVAAMIAQAKLIREAATPLLLQGEEEHSLHIPVNFRRQPLPDDGTAAAAEACEGTTVPPDTVCLRGSNTVAYCVGGDWQACHLVVQLQRRVTTLSDVRPDESYELFAAAQILQETMEKIQKDVSTTFIVKNETSCFESVHLHILPWLKVYEHADEVYDYINSYTRNSGDTERALAAAIRRVVYNGENCDQLQSLISK